MKVLLEYNKAELVIKNSRFIAESFPVQSQAAARDKLHELKLKYSDATHVVHAFIVGKAGEVSGMSDDGEPSGTAGRPVLDVLKGSGITNILITVTRYFGGTLLGTGGLVHAYGDSAKEVLSSCKAETFVEKKHFSFSTDYSLYESIKRIYNNYHIEQNSEEFDTTVSAFGVIYADEASSFCQQVFNMTKGQTEVIITSCI
jgi:uncharacterized YigZ family protein